MRPSLNREISIDDLNNYYWLKEELQEFCWTFGLGTSGSKEELFNRILQYLTTGQVNEEVKVKPKTSSPAQQGPLSLDTIIVENHKCSQNVRAFFKSVIPNFHFSVYIQNFFKENVGKTYRDVVEAWYEEVERKKDPNYKKPIGKQFEYNQFIRDYFADPKNKYKSRDSAIEAWNEIKKLPGSNKYVPKI